MDSVKGQLTLRGIVIGCVGCAIITAASVYTALKMGALPWPIVFAAIISLFFLKALGHGKASLNEANVTHTVMSAGAMVAGGLAFTIPGIWMLGYADKVGWFEMLLVAVSGVIMGLVCTALLRRHFIEDSELEYPIGEAAAQTLIAGDSGGKTGWKLFGSMGFAGAFTALRDFFGVIPAMLFGNAAVPGVAFGIYLSPMLLAVGFLVGTGAVVVWFVGALLANFGIIMGVMMGAGLGVIFKNILPKAWRMLRDARSSNAFGLTAASTMDAPASGAKDGRLRIGSFRLTAGLAALAVAAVALIVCFGLQLGPVPAVIVVLLAFVATAMSAQSVGQTGIDPMEIFGLIVLLAVAAVSSVPQVQLFFVAGIVAVACGLAGDVMNDFHAGHVLGTSPKAQWIGQAIGAVLGALVAVAVMAILVSAYGPESFGPTASFVSAQASVVATMVSGIPSVPAFAIGLAAGFVLYLLNFPAMMLGLGIYLPFYMSLTAFLGAMAKVAYDAVCKLRRKGLSPEAAAEKEKAQGETGLVVSSGLLGGESIVGVLVAIAAASPETDGLSGDSVRFGRQLPQSGEEWLVVQGAYGEHVRRSRARARQAPNDTSRFIVPRNSILIEELDEATRVRHVFAREPHDRHAVKGELSLSVLFVGKDAHRCPAAAQRRVLVLLHPIELADNPAAVQPRPEEVDAIRTPSIERPRQSHLKLGKREAMLDHRGARDGFATAFATGISVVHRPHGMCRSFEIAADAPNMGNERACPAPTEA